MNQEQIEKNKEKFISIFTEHIKREGADKLLEWIKKSDFFTAPFTTQYNLSEEGGLCKHALDTYNRFRTSILRELGTEYEKNYSEESIAIVGLLSCLHKVNCYKKDIKKVKDENGMWTDVPIYKFDDALPFGKGAKSVFILQTFMKLLWKESEPIRFYLGGHEYPSDTMIEPNMPKIFNESIYTLLIYTADLEATYIDEKVV